MTRHKLFQITTHVLVGCLLLQDISAAAAAAVHRAPSTVRCARFSEDAIPARQTHFASNSTARIREIRWEKVQRTARHPATLSIVSGLLALWQKNPAYLSGIALATVQNPPSGEARDILAQKVAVILFGSFDAYYNKFKDITRRAKSRFENKEWKEAVDDADQRIHLYGQMVSLTEQELRLLLGPLAEDPEFWVVVDRHYTPLVQNQYEWRLAHIFFDSIILRLLKGNSPFKIDRYEDGNEDAQKADYQHILEVYPNSKPLNEVVIEIVKTPAFHTRFDNLLLDSRLAAERIQSDLVRLTGSSQWDSIEILKPVFYRNKGAYLVGRIRQGKQYVPFSLALLNRETENGIIIDAALLGPEDLRGLLFTSTRSNFHVDTAHYQELVQFLTEIVPERGRAGLLVTIGFILPGKIAFLQKLRNYIRESKEKFVEPEGIRGTVMAAFTLPDYPYVFKLVREKSPKLSYHGVGAVMAKYREVHERDRIGRMLDTWLYRHVKFPRSAFSEEVLAELQEDCPSTVHMDDVTVEFEHLYVQRKVIPLFDYLRSDVSLPEKIAALVDFGWAFKDLAKANIFMGDYNTKNFGVTHAGRVVTFDFDDFADLQRMHFMNKPPTHDDEEEQQNFENEDPSWLTNSNTVVPEFLGQFGSIPADLMPVFNDTHGDLQRTRYWVNIQKRLSRGETISIYPYPRSKRLRKSLEAEIPGSTSDEPVSVPLPSKVFRAEDGLPGLARWLSGLLYGSETEIRNNVVTAIDHALSDDRWDPERRQAWAEVLEKAADELAFVKSPFALPFRHRAAQLLDPAYPLSDFVLKELRKSIVWEFPKPGTQPAKRSIVPLLASNLTPWKRGAYFVRSEMGSKILFELFDPELQAHSRLRVGFRKEQGRYILESRHDEFEMTARDTQLTLLFGIFPSLDYGSIVEAYANSSNAPFFIPLGFQRHRETEASEPEFPLSVYRMRAINCRVNGIPGTVGFGATVGDLKRIWGGPEASFKLTFRISGNAIPDNYRIGLGEAFEVELLPLPRRAQTARAQRSMRRSGKTLYYPGSGVDLATLERFINAMKDLDHIILTDPQVTADHLAAEAHERGLSLDSKGKNSWILVMNNGRSVTLKILSKDAMAYRMNTPADDVLIKVPGTMAVLSTQDAFYKKAAVNLRPGGRLWVSMAYWPSEKVLKEASLKPIGMFHSVTLEPLPDISLETQRSLGGMVPIQYYAVFEKEASPARQAHRPPKSAGFIDLVSLFNSRSWPVWVKGLISYAVLSIIGIVVYRLLPTSSHPQIKDLFLIPSNLVYAFFFSMTDFLGQWMNGRKWDAKQTAMMFPFGIILGILLGFGFFLMDLALPIRGALLANALAVSTLWTAGYVLYLPKVTRTFSGTERPSWTGRAVYQALPMVALTASVYVTARHFYGNQGSPAWLMTLLRVIWPMILNNYRVAAKALMVSLFRGASAKNEQDKKVASESIERATEIWWILRLVGFLKNDVVQMLVSEDHRVAAEGITSQFFQQASCWAANNDHFIVKSDRLRRSKLYLMFYIPITMAVWFIKHPKILLSALLLSMAAFAKGNEPELSARYVHQAA